MIYILQEDLFFGIKYGKEIRVIEKVEDKLYRFKLKRTKLDMIGNKLKIKKSYEYVVAEEFYISKDKKITYLNIPNIRKSKNE